MKRDEIQVDLASDPRLLNAVRGLVRGYLATAGITGERADCVVLAVDEACANSIRHSYQGSTDRRIGLTLHSEPDAIVFAVSDDGVPAELERCRKKESTAAPDGSTLQPGGLGVQLIYRVFDEVCYEPGQERGNRVTMRLALESDGRGTNRRAENG